MFEDEILIEILNFQNDSHIVCIHHILHQFLKYFIAFIVNMIFNDFKVCFVDSHFDFSFDILSLKNEFLFFNVEVFIVDFDVLRKHCECYIQTTIEYTHRIQNVFYFFIS